MVDLSALAVASSEYRKCPCCKRDKWRSEIAPSGYCVSCARTKGRVSATKMRNADRSGFNAYHREYNKTWLKERPKMARSRTLSDL